MWNGEGGQWEETAWVEEMINHFLHKLQSARSVPWICSLLFSLVQMSKFSMVSAASSPVDPRDSWKILVSGWAFSATMSRCLFFPDWKNNPTWPFHLSLAEVYLSMSSTLLSSFSQKWLSVCSLCSQGYPLCAAGLANFLCSAHFFPSVAKLQELPLHEEWPASQWWDHDLFSDFLQLETPTKLKGFMLPL